MQLYTKNSVRCCVPKKASGVRLSVFATIIPVLMQKENSAMSSNLTATAASAIAVCAGLALGAEKPAEAPAPAASTNVTVVIATNYGEITVELDAEKAPLTVANFLSYVDEKFYDGTIFHRVIKNFMIQGGGFTPDMLQKRTKAPVKNEAGNGLRNVRGTIAMARTMVVDSATAQFFINTVDNDFLDHRDESVRGFGYAVFGKVTDGMAVVDAIASVATGKVNGMADVPTPAPVVITSIRRK